MLKPIYEVEKDRVSGVAKVVRINPTRMYNIGTQSGPCWYQWQNGAWNDLNGNHVEAKDVPEGILAQLEATPVVVDAGGPDIAKVCRFCQEKMNASQLEEHLIQHVAELMKGAGAAAKPADADIPPPVTAKK